jgi:hypothetical protein
MKAVAGRSEVPTWTTLSRRATFHALYRLMADDLCYEASTAPSFDDAVALQRILSASEEAVETGQRVRVGG